MYFSTAFGWCLGVHDVSIRLDLETVFQFSHLVLTFKVHFFKCFSLPTYLLVLVIAGESSAFTTVYLQVLRSFCCCVLSRVSDRLPCWLSVPKILVIPGRSSATLPRTVRSTTPGCPTSWLRALTTLSVTADTQDQSHPRTER